MPSVRQPATALRDRAERHVFGVLPELPAVQRRVLALLDLCDEPLDAVAAELGAEPERVRAAAAAGRKALRRTRGPLASGARCERAERLHSDRTDAPLERHARRWLEIHVARCPRCAEHAALLDEARNELRVGFAAPARQLPAPPPEPPALGAGRAQLRVVAPAAEPPSPAPAQAPAPAPVAARPPAPPPAERAAPPTVPVRRRPRPAVSPAAKKAAKVLAIVLAIAAILAGLGIGLSSLSGGDHQKAPWTQKGAPDVRPAPLSGQ